MNSVYRIRVKYLLFIGVIILTTAITQLVIHTYLIQQREDASLINTAGRQRMLCQRITKLALFIERAAPDRAALEFRQDSLRVSISKWREGHELLLKRKAFRSGEIDSLLSVQTRLMQSTFAACALLLANTDDLVVRSSLAVIEQNDLPFLLNMQKITKLFQNHSEVKLKQVERSEYLMALISIFVITAGFFFTVMPTLRRLRFSNDELRKLNSDLFKQDTRIRESLAEVTRLQSDLEKSEKQYRERVQDAVDAIYECNFRGAFTYFNPGTEKLTGYSSDELIKMRYDELVDKSHREEVVRFYEDQFKAKAEVTYKEFPIRTRTGERVWLGQTARMMFCAGRLETVHVVVRDITQLYESISRLEKSERRFRSLADNLSVGVHELNSSGEIAYVNPRWFEICGLPENSTLQDLINTIHDDDRERIQQAWAEAIRDKKEVSLEFRFNNPLRGVVWVTNRTAPMFDSRGNLQGYIGTLSDVTELKNASLKIIESEKLYRLISTNSQDLITLYNNDQNATRTYISPSAKTILGYEPEELIGASPFEIILPEDVERMRETTHKDTLMGNVSNVEYRVRKKDGTIIWMESSSHPYHDENGTVIGFQTSAREITKRKQVEHDLAERERLYRLLSENSKDVIALHQPDGAYMFVSSSVKNILGYLPEELTGTSPYEIIHPDDHDYLKNGAHQQALQGESQSNIEYRVRKKDGSYLWLETYLQPIIDSNGNVTAIQSSSRDISQHKILTQELTEAKVRAEEANIAKSQFLSVMSHEIRTPMNAVIGLTNFMLEENPGDRQRANLNLLKYAGENLLAIINDILDFSKIEAGRIELGETTFDLQELLRNIAEMMNHRARAKNLDLLLESDPQLPNYVKGDPVRLNQVLYNLLGNAIKFTASGTVKLEVTMTGSGNGCHEILFSVEDSGIGIAKEDLELIFERFSQASKDITRRFGGTGLGLAITRKLVNLMGGHIQVSSELGQGSHFYFTLMFKEADPADLVQVSMSATEILVAGESHVLLVEDNEVNQVVVINFLTKWGLKVTLANDGYEALKKIKDRSYHLVLMDMQMPGMDGSETTRRIRQMEDRYFRNIPIIALTASALADKEAMISREGLNDYITKPFRPEELHKKIFHYLRSYQVTVQLPQPEIDLAGYTKNDPEKKKVFQQLMINDLSELTRALKAVLVRSDHSYHQVSHKVKTTISIINDPHLSDLIKELDRRINGRKKITGEVKSRIDDVCRICDEKIQTLSNG